MVGPDSALQLLTRGADPVENRLSSEIETCDQSLRSFRASFARHNLQLTNQTADIVDTCIARARQLFSAAQRCACVTAYRVHYVRSI
jgi:hypothetical protein